MSDAYKYVDPDHTYTDPKTGVLRNLQDIADSDVLLFVESSVVTKRLQEFNDSPIKIKGIDRGYFEKSDGNIRALIVNVDARDLIRIVLDDEVVRNKADMNDSEYEGIKSFQVLEDAFDNNVRTYLKKSSINKNW